MTPDLLPMPKSLLDRFARAGVDTAALLRTVGIPRSRFEVAKPQGTTAEFFALWQGAEAGDPDSNLGLRLGTDTAPHQQNIAALAALHSSNLEESFRKLARYKRLVCPEKIQFDVRRAEARLTFEWLLAKTHPPPSLIDCIFAGVVDLAQRGTGTRVQPKRLELTRRRCHEGRLARHFACEVHFDAPTDRLVFDASVLTLPLLTHNPQLLAVIVPGLEEALRATDGSRTLADDVKTALRESICGERPAVGKVARTLGLSARTLQRRLGELGTTYQRLLDEVRRQSARRLLAATDLAAPEVAFLLGFEELNSFTRAFQAWEGTTPTKWRATAR